MSSPQLRDLRTAWEHGWADAAVLNELLFQLEGDWNYEAYKAGALEQEEARSSSYDALEEARLARLYIDAHHGPEEQRVLTALLAAAPDEATPCYWQARIAATRGDYAQAMEYLTTGNNQPQCSRLESFLTRDFENRSSSAEGGRDPALLGSEEWVSRHDSPIGYVWQGMPGQLEAEACQRHDRAGLQTLRRCILRQSEPRYASALLAEMQGAVLKDWTGPLGAAQKQALQDDAGTMRQLVTLGATASAWNDDSPLDQAFRAGWRLKLVDPACAAQRIYLLHNNTIRRTAAHRGLLPLFITSSLGPTAALLPKIHRKPGACGADRSIAFHIPYCPVYPGTARSAWIAFPSLTRDYAGHP